MLDIDNLKQELTGQFPEYSFSTVRRLQGICIVVTKSKYHGADIFIKKNKIIIEAGFPAFKTRLLWGAGVLWKKTLIKNFTPWLSAFKAFWEENIKQSSAIRRDDQTAALSSGRK